MKLSNEYSIQHTLLISRAISYKTAIVSPAWLRKSASLDSIRPGIFSGAYLNEWIDNQDRIFHQLFYNRIKSCAWLLGIVDKSKHQDESAAVCNSCWSRVTIGTVPSGSKYDLEKIVSNDFIRSTVDYSIGYFYSIL